MNRPSLRKILFLHKMHDVIISSVREAAPEATVVVAEDAAEVDREIVDATVVIGGIVTDEQLRSARELVWHHVPWVGVESVVKPVMQEKAIMLTNGSGVNSENIAEHVVAMMLMFARDLHSFVRHQDKHEWRKWEEDAPQFFEIGGQRVLCLGTGDIGQEVAKRLASFGCEIIGASRSGRHIPGFDHCVSFEHLDEELPKADHVICSLPMTASTVKIVGREQIQAMKQGAYFHNVGRGGTVDQDALIEALQSGHLAGAGLDVVSPEPLPDDSPLWDMKNVIITSHTSGNSPKAVERMAELAVAQIKRYQAGEPLHNVVDLSSGY